MKTILLLLLPSFAIASENRSSLEAVFGDESTAPIHNSKSQAISGDQVIPPLEDGSNIDDLVSKARKEWEKAASDSVKQPESTFSESSPSDPSLPSVPAQTLPEEVKIESPILAIRQQKPSRVVKHFTENKPKIFESTGEAITVFTSNTKPKDEETITLPSGGHAFGRVKFGEEVTAQGNTEVLAELDYAFLGPNQSVVEMNGCVVWIKVQANFHTQRVNGQMADLTCTMPSGRVFTIEVEGPLIAAATGYAGSDSNLIMRGPAKAAALKFLSEFTTAYGAATSAVETTTSVVAGEHTTDKATNVTGNKEAYIQGKVLESHGKFLTYISSFYESMQPTLALAPGTKIHVVNRKNVKIPKVFFKPKEEIK